MQYATVQTVAPLTVLVDSSDTDDPAVALASYTPVVDDRVAVVRLGGQLLVLGKVIP